MAQPKNAAHKRPDDQPFDFDLDAVKAEVALTPWVIKHGGQRWSLAHAQDLDVMPLMKAARGGDAEAVIGTIRAALGDQWPAFEKMGLKGYKAQALFDGYQKHCGIVPGESDASSGS
ncbi:hypothetical protein [Streptomyces sp. CAU 1734]|uniref:hypothetical protein n=1 Tax=Streptomyces sp. CAU 1734 TaxID=3140360 RepID=UPI0032617D3D